MDYCKYYGGNYTRSGSETFCNLFGTKSSSNLKKNIKSGRYAKMFGKNHRQSEILNNFFQKFLSRFDK
jgi:hypothetical protein